METRSAMEVKLQSIGEAGLSMPEQDIFNILRDSLTSSTANQDAKMADIANRLYDLCPATASEAEITTILWNLWLMMINIVRLVPPDHPWQDILVGALNNLRGRDRAGESQSIGGSKLCKDLPILPMAIRDTWFDPTEDSDEPYTRFDAESRQNLNAFVARLTASGYKHWALTFPVWSLRTALEEPAPVPTAEGAQLAMETRLRVVSEWILRCGTILFAEMSMASSSEGALDEDTTRAIALGGLCEEGMSPLGRQRWDFWKKRLEEMVGSRDGDGEMLQLEEPVRERIAEPVLATKFLEEGS